MIRAWARSGAISVLAAVLLAGAVAPRHAMAQTSPVVTVTLASTGTHALPGFNTNPSENGESLR